MKTNKKNIQKKSALFEMINKLIDIRIKKILPGIVKEEVEAYILLLNEQLTEQPESNSKKSELSSMVTLSESVAPVEAPRQFSRPVPQKPAIRTGNSKLDEAILSAGSRKEYESNTGFGMVSQMEEGFNRMAFAQESMQSGFEEYPNLMNKPAFTQNDMGALPSINQSKPMYTVDTMTGADGRRISSDSYAGQLVNSVMNRDYSELVKRFKK